MRTFILNFVLIILSKSVCSQIWDFPPMPFVYSASDSVYAKNKIFQVISWNHEIVAGLETGKKDLLSKKTFDIKGNLVEEITGWGDTILYDLYNRGYWALKITNQEIFHQKVIFDSTGKVINLTVNDYEITIQYDQLNRPLQAINSSGKQVWEYQDLYLKRYLQYDTSLSQVRDYYYFEEENKIAYSCHYYMPNGMKYPNIDSVVAKMDSLQRPIHVVSYRIKGEVIDSTEVTFDRLNNTSKVLASYGCTKQSVELNEKGLRTALYQTDCSGTMIRKVTFEYVEFN